MSAVASRLMANQDEIAEALEEHVGDTHAGRVRTLLRDHIAAAAAVLNLPRGSTADARAAALDAFFANGDELGNEFAAITTMSAPTAREEFRKHNQHVLRLATEAGEEQIRTYDAYYTHMLALSDAIVAQLRRPSVGKHE